MSTLLNSFPLAGEEALAEIDQQILALLSQGRMISGEEVGEVVGTSRAYVWKRIASLKKQGVEIISAHGEGYRLPENQELLTLEKLTAYLTVSTLPLRLCWRLPSTNAAATELALEFPETEFVIISESQTEGRGRRGKQWLSPFGGDLYMSYKAPFEGGAKSFQGLSLVVGVAVITALKKITNAEGLSLKWPNDLYYQGRKFGGILVEMTGDINGKCDAIIGIGINATFQSAEQTGQEVASILEFLPKKTDRNFWVAELINELSNTLKKFRQVGLTPFIESWSNYDFLNGQPVTVFLGETAIQGLAVGISATGALEVRTAQGLQNFYAGDVSVRKQ